jgi:hypothetical protein
MPPRTFVLELLEFVLSHRPQPFHSLPQFRSLLQSRVCGIVESLLRQGLQPGADSGELAEVRLVLKAAGALVRKHAQLAPAAAATLVQLLQQGCGAARAPWQRIASLQVVRSLVGDQLLVYQLFDMFDMSIEHDLNAVQVRGGGGGGGARLLDRPGSCCRARRPAAALGQPAPCAMARQRWSNPCQLLTPLAAPQDLAKTLADTSRAFVAAAVEQHNEGSLHELNTLFVSRQAGKDPVPDLEQLGPVIPNPEVRAWLAAAAGGCLAAAGGLAPQVGWALQAGWLLQATWLLQAAWELQAGWLGGGRPRAAGRRGVGCRSSGPAAVRARAHRPPGVPARRCLWRTFRWTACLCWCWASRA